MADNKNAAQEQELIPSLDIFELYEKYKTKIFTGVIAVVAIVIISIFYTSQSNTTEDNAWLEFGNFQQKLFANPDISQSEIQEIIQTTEGSSAEPWVLLFCSTVYFQQRDIDNAKNLLDRIKSDFSNHFVCKNDRLYESVNTFISNEDSWTQQNL